MPGSKEVAEAAWLDLVSVDAADVRFVELSADMDPGEAAAICVAEDLGALLLCDDGLARAMAKDRGLPVIGTLGVLLRAKRLGKLSLIQPVIARMIKAGMRVSPALLDLVLRQAEESPT